MHAWAPCVCWAGGRALTWGRALRRGLENTRVFGDVWGWKALARAKGMCVKQRRHGACAGALCVFGTRIGAHMVRSLHRGLYNTQVSGDVSGWKALSHADWMCVQQRRHGACVSAVCFLDGGSTLTGGEGAAQTPE